MIIPDESGLTRFKSGIFVDNFTTTQNQLISGNITNPIDPINTELRPSHFTTEVDMLIGSRSLIGIGTTANPNVSPAFVTDIVGSNFRRTGQVLLLTMLIVLKFRIHLQLERERNSVSGY